MNMHITKNISEFSKKKKKKIKKKRSGQGVLPVSNLNLASCSLKMKENETIGS